MNDDIEAELQAILAGAKVADALVADTCKTIAALVTRWLNPQRELLRDEGIVILATDSASTFATFAAGLRRAADALEAAARGTGHPKTPDCAGIPDVMEVIGRPSFGEIPVLIQMRREGQ